MYLYPKTLSDLKDKDIFEIKHPTKELWDNLDVYDNSYCRSRKNYIEYLMVTNRIRIKK